MNSTGTQRRLYAPACSGKKLFWGAYEALDVCLRVFKYRPEPGHTGAYNCRKITGGSGYSLHAFGPDERFKFWSGVSVTMALAVDINWRRNPYGKRLITDMPRPMIEAVLRVRSNTGAQVWGWGGNYRGNKDAMHFEIVCGPNDLRSGINSKTLPGSITSHPLPPVVIKPPPPPPPPWESDVEVFMVYGKKEQVVYLVTDRALISVNDSESYEALRKRLGEAQPVTEECLRNFKEGFGTVIPRENALPVGGPPIA